MSLLTSLKTNFINVDVGTVHNLSVHDVHATAVDVAALVVTDTTVTNSAVCSLLQATTANVAGTDAAVVNTTSLLSTSATFTNPPTCAAQPVLDSQLATKAYVDAVIGGGGGGGGGGVEVVTGTDPVSATVTTTLLSGTTHALPLSTTKGAEKVIVNMNENALSTIFTQPTLLNQGQTSVTITRVAGMAYDSVLNRMYIVGNFQQVNGVAGTTGVAYYNFSNQTWNALGGGLPTTFGNPNNVQATVVLVVGTRVYVGGQFAAVLDAGGNPVADTANVAYFDTNPANNQWYSLGVGVFDNRVYNLRSFAPGAVYIVGQFSNRVVRFNEGDGTLTTFGVTTSARIRDCFITNNRLFICGDFTSITAGSVVANSAYLAYYDFTNWYGYNANNQLNASVYKFTLYNSQLLINGNFTSVGTSSTQITPLNVVAVVDTFSVAPTLSQFPAPVYAATGANQQDKLYVDSSNQLWYTTETTNDRQLNPTTDPSSAYLNKQVDFSGVAKFNGQFWEPVVAVPTWAFAEANAPNIKWIGVVVAQIVNNVINGHSGLLQLDESLVQKVSSTFNENSVPREQFVFNYKHQSVTLVNSDNLGWVVKSRSSGASSTQSTQVVAPIAFF